MSVFDLSADPGPVHPRHSAAPADPVRPARAGARARAAAGRDRRADRDPGVARPRCASWSPPSWPTWPSGSAPAPHGAAGGQRRRPGPPPCPLEVADDPCLVLLSSAGLLARTAAAARWTRRPRARWSAAARAPAAGGPRRAAVAHDAIVSAVPATARGTIGVVTSLGRLIRLSVLEIPALPPSAHSPGLAGGAPIGEFVGTEPGETVVASPRPTRPGPASRWAPRPGWSSGWRRTTRAAPPTSRSSR